VRQIEGKVLMLPYSPCQPPTIRTSQIPSDKPVKISEINAQTKRNCRNTKKSNKNGGVCVKCWENVSKVEPTRNRKKMRQRPMKLKHLPSRWNFLYSLCAATTLTNSTPPLIPSHADWNPINAADGEKQRKKKKKIMKNKRTQSFQPIFSISSTLLPVPMSWAACLPAFDEQTTWKKGKWRRGAWHS